MKFKLHAQEIVFLNYSFELYQKQEVNYNIINNNPSLEL